MTRLFWMIFQLAVVGFWIWVAVDANPDNPDIHSALVLGGLFAFALTIIPLAIVEGVKDVRRLYLPAIRRWRYRKLHRAAAALAPKRDAGEPIDRLHRPRRIALTREPPE
jgi:hypothetical protein